MTDKEFRKMMFHVSDIQEYINQGGMCLYEGRLIVKELWVALSSHPHEITLTFDDYKIHLVTPDTSYVEAYFRLTKAFEIYEFRPTSEIFTNRPASSTTAV